MSDGEDWLEEVRFAIGRRLRARRSEIVDAIYACVRDAVPDPAADLSADYQAGVLDVTTALVGYCLEGIERGSEWSAPIPPAAAAQVRRAARVGVSLGIVQRRYLVGHRCLGEFVAQEVESIDTASDRPALHHLHKAQQALLEHLMAALEHEYNEESRVARSPEQRRLKLVQRLLVDDVDLAELKELDYDVFSTWHLGVIAIGAKGRELVQGLAAGPGRELLSVPGEDDRTVWAWFGGKAKLTVAEFKRLHSANAQGAGALAIGEPGSGLDGWRQTHQEAQVALIVARHELKGLTRCADALPVAGAVQNEAIIKMYEKTYVLPLNELRKGGQPAREALRAYFKHGRSASTAGEAIRMSRRTVESYLKDARKVLGDPLNLTGLEIALRLEELGYMAKNSAASPVQKTDCAPRAIP